MSGLDPFLKEKLLKNLKLDLAKFSLYEEAEKKQRFIRPWVKSSPLTHRLGRNSRLLNTVVNSVKNSLGRQVSALLDPQVSAALGPQLEAITEDQLSNDATGTLDKVWV